MDPPTYFKLDLIYDFLCSVKQERLPVTSSMLEDGIRNHLNLCPQATAAQSGSRMNYPLSVS